MMQSSARDSGNDYFMQVLEEFLIPKMIKIQEFLMSLFVERREL